MILPTVDAQLRESRGYDPTKFPVAFYRSELAERPNHIVPLHWHPDFEILTAETSTIDYQVGQQHIMLAAGDTIFVNENVLHGMRQVTGAEPDPMPNIVFSGMLVAPEASAIYRKYIRPIIYCDMLPFIVFRHGEGEATPLILDTYRCLEQRAPCYEMRVQRNISALFEWMYCNFDALPKADVSRVQVKNQVRMQQMLGYIHTHYAQTVTLADIAAAANISRSEAGRCFAAYMDCSPVEALIEYRLETARGTLHDTTMSLQEIAEACGFNSANYFSRQYKRVYGCAPGQKNTLGK